MAKKKASIGDLIKSDMSRRAIGEEPKIAEKASEVPPPENKTKTPASRPAIPKGSADLMIFIMGEAKSAGLTEENDLCTFYAFLPSQSMRYIKGFDAGRRFHG